MGQAIGGILPLAIAVDISVLSIIAVILMLITPRARSNGPAFVAGWVLGLVAVGGLVLIIANGPVFQLQRTVHRGLRHQGPWGVAPAAGGQAVAQPSRAGRAGPGAEVDGGSGCFTPVKSLGLGAAMSG